MFAARACLLQLILPVCLSLSLAAGVVPATAQTAAPAPAASAGWAGPPLAVAGVMQFVPTVSGARLRLALSRPLAQPPSTFVLDEPMRIVVDLHGASTLQRQADGSGPVQRARLSQFDGTTVRIVVDLAEPMRLVEAVQDSAQVLELRLAPVTAAQFAAERRRGRTGLGSFPQEAPLAVPPGPAPAPDPGADSRRMAEVERAVAEVGRAIPPPTSAPPPASTAPVDQRVQAAPGSAVDTRAAAAKPAPEKPVTEKPATGAPAAPPRATPVASARSRTPARHMVVIDAGHGGNDPGAPVVTGGHEKEVTLAIARAIGEEVQKRARAGKLPIDVKLTRDSDHFISLGRRVRLARDWGASLFLSVHADSAANSEARGASIYTLSDVASDKEAARVAAKENRADLIAGVDLSGERREVANILIDLGLRDSMNASSDFAELLQRRMEPKGVLFRSNFHRYAGFQVLRNLGVPAALLETGFVSNRDDAAYLKSKKGQQQIAAGAADAIIAYLTSR